jgi:hypothetical protein
MEQEQGALRADQNRREADQIRQRKAAARLAAEQQEQ